MFDVSRGIQFSSVCFFTDGVNFPDSPHCQHQVTPAVSVLLTSMETVLHGKCRATCFWLSLPVQHAKSDSEVFPVSALIKASPLLHVAR